MTREATFARLLAADRFEPRAPLDDGRPGELLYARDRGATAGVVTTIRPAGRDRRWLMHTALWRDGDGWKDAEFENGDRWPFAPDAERPAHPGFAMVGHLHGRVNDDPDCSFLICAGIAGRGVAAVEVETPLDRHRVEIDELTGGFVAIGAVVDGVTITWTAVAADGSPLDVASHTLALGPWEEAD